jgi:putrescine aminotransferase
MKKKLLSVDDAKKLDIQTVQKLYKDYISESQLNFFKNFSFGNDIIQKAEGSFIYTDKNKKILDLTGGIGVLNHGHNNDRILGERIKFQNEKKMEVHKLFFSQYLAALSYNIAQMLPGDLNRSFFPNSGAEAVEGAIKLAYKFYNGARKNIIHSDISFHGKTIGASSISGSKEINFDYQKLPNVEKFIFNDFDSLKNKVYEIKKKKEQCYAIIVEPLSASTLKKSSDNFLKQTRKLCDEENIILIYDEIYSGWCKTGHLFNFFSSNTIPDILVYAKSFGGGKASISGYTTRDHVMLKAYDNSDDFSLQSSTYNGFGEECITAIEAINLILENNFEEKSQQNGIKIKNILQRIKKEFPQIVDEIRGSGSFQGFTIKNPINENIESLITKFIPIKTYRDKNFFKKLLCASIINYMYKEKNILTFGSFASDVLFKVSPAIEIDSKELDKFEIELLDTLSVGVFNLIGDFLKYKFTKK